VSRSANLGCFESLSGAFIKNFISSNLSIGKPYFITSGIVINTNALFTDELRKRAWAAIKPSSNAFVILFPLSQIPSFVDRPFWGKQLLIGSSSFT